LIQGVEPSKGTSVTQAAPEHGGGKAECGREQHRIRISKIRMVKDIEELCFEQQICVFPKLKLSAECEIKLMDRKSSQDIPAKRSLSRRIWYHERPDLRIGITGNDGESVVETFSARRCWVVNIQRNSGYEIGAQIGTSTEGRAGGSVKNVYWCRRARGENSINRSITKYRVCCSTPEEWTNIVSYARVKGMPYIKV